MKKIITIVAIAFSMALSQKTDAQCLSAYSNPVVGRFSATTNVGQNVVSPTNGTTYLNEIQGNFYEVKLNPGYQYRFWLSYWLNTYEVGATSFYSTLTDTANNILVPFAQGAYINYSTKVPKTVRIHISGNNV